MAANKRDTSKLSLHPLTTAQALRGLLAVKPPPKEAAARSAAAPAAAAAAKPKKGTRKDAVGPKP